MQDRKGNTTGVMQANGNANTNLRNWDRDTG